jgi:hypothetical protein
MKTMNLPFYGLAALLISGCGGDGGTASVPSSNSTITNPGSTSSQISADDDFIQGPINTTRWTLSSQASDFSDDTGGQAMEFKGDTSGVVQTATSNYVLVGAFEVDAQLNMMNTNPNQQVDFRLQCGSNANDFVEASYGNNIVTGNQYSGMYWRQVVVSSQATPAVQSGYGQAGSYTGSTADLTPGAGYYVLPSFTNYRISRANNGTIHFMIDDGSGWTDYGSIGPQSAGGTYADGAAVFTANCRVVVRFSNTGTNNDMEFTRLNTNGATVQWDN